MPIEDNSQDLADLITASLEAMQMNSSYTTVKMEPGWKYKPSELELRIRREVMNELEDVIQKHEELALNKTGLLHIKDRLSLLWKE